MIHKFQYQYSNIAPTPEFPVGGGGGAIASPTGGIQNLKPLCSAAPVMYSNTTNPTTLEVE